MTREDAIKNLNMISVAFVEPVTMEQRKLIDDTFEMAISALEQQPCDAVSRDFLFKVLDDFCGHSRDATITLDTLADIVYELPPVTVRQTGEWIPVSERLPEAFRFVNCTCHSLIDDREDWVVETCYLPQPPNSPYSDWGNIPMLNMGDCEVVAWMYRDIPKPYKVEPQESEE